MISAATPTSPLPSRTPSVQFRRALDRAKSSILRRHSRSNSLSEVPSSVLEDPPYNKPPKSGVPVSRIPSEIVVDIFALCSFADILRLRLVCRTFRDTINSNQKALVKRYLEHGSAIVAAQRDLLPKSGSSSPATPTLRKAVTMRTKTETDLHLAQLAKLFPPPKMAVRNTVTTAARGNSGRPSSGTKEAAYTLSYLHELDQKRNICDRLSLVVSTQAVAEFMTKEEGMFKSQSRKERKESRERAIAVLRAKTTPRMFPILHFLLSYHTLRLSTQLSLAIDFDQSVRPRLSPADRRKLFSTLQSTLIARYSDVQLVEMQHTFVHLLASLRRAMSAPEEEFGLTPPSSPGGPNSNSNGYLRDTSSFFGAAGDSVKNDNWISMMLHQALVERIVEFYDAENPSPTMSTSARMKHRKDFMNRVETDWADWEKPQSWFGISSSGTPTRDDDYGSAVLQHPSGLSGASLGRAASFRIGAGVDGRDTQKGKDMMGVDEIWFECAGREIKKRGLVGHEREMVLTFRGEKAIVWGCGACEGVDGMGRVSEWS